MGPTYCEGCKASGAACATTHPKQCAYRKYGGRDDAERLAWAVFEAESWRLRIGGMGVVLGIDGQFAIKKLVRAGLDEGLAEDLIAACEQGMAAALNTKEDDDDQGSGHSPVSEG